MVTMTTLHARQFHKIHVFNTTGGFLAGCRLIILLHFSVQLLPFSCVLFIQTHSVSSFLNHLHAGSGWHEWDTIPETWIQKASVDYCKRLASRSPDASMPDSKKWPFVTIAVCRSRTFTGQSSFTCISPNQQRDNNFLIKNLKNSAGQALSGSDRKTYYVTKRRVSYISKNHSKREEKWCPGKHVLPVKCLQKR